MLVEAHIGTLSVLGHLYDLGKTRVFISREYYQASYGIGGFFGERTRFDS